MKWAVFFTGAQTGWLPLMIQWRPTVGGDWTGRSWPAQIYPLLFLQLLKKSCGAVHSCTSEGDEGLRMAVSVISIPVASLSTTWREGEVGWLASEAVLDLLFSRLALISSYETWWTIWRKEERERKREREVVTNCSVQLNLTELLVQWDIISTIPLIYMGGWFVRVLY